MADPGESAASGPGPALRTAREALGIALEDVADAMNVPVATVHHIEENAFDRLPAPPFTRGYIRTYARLLRLDGDVLVGEYGEAILDEGESKLVVEVEKPSLAELPQRHPGWVFGGAVFAVAVAGALVLWWAWPQEPEPRAATSPVAAAETPRAAPGASRATAPTPAPARSPAGDAAPRLETGSPADAAAPAAAETPAVSPDLTLPTPDSDALALPDAETEPGPVEAPATVPETVSLREILQADPEPERGDAPEPDPFSGPDLEPLAAGADLLELAFVGDCWVEVFDREGRIVHMDMSLAGDSLRLQGEAPFSIRLGNAPAATLAFNGEPVELAPHTRANVANLVLGE